jgi:Arc/MetJ-type ribon-helix-helix transcriptional regulator
MRANRLTVLLSDDERADVDSKASRLGVSSSEYIRLAVSNFDGPTADEEAELSALLEQVNAAVPRMQAAFDRMSEKIQKLHAENDAFFKAKGID